MRKGKGLGDRAGFELIRSTDEDSSKFNDKRGHGILEKLIRQNPEKRAALERAHEKLHGDPHYASAMHAAVLSMNTKKIRVFISYRLNADADAAKAITSVLTTLSDDIEVTFAAGFPSKIPGQDFREEIQRAISEAHWFIVLLSDPRQTSEWVMFETGMFRASMVSKRMNRLICIHHPNAEPPDQIGEYQAVSADQDNLSQLLQGLFCEPNPLPGWETLRPNIKSDAIQSAANEIVSAFKDPSTPTKFNRWVKLEVKQPDSLSSWEDLNPCKIESDTRALELFGKSQAPPTWGGLIKNVINENDTKKWLEELYATIVKAIDGDAFRPIGSTFECSDGGRVMRPILHSMETDGNGEVFQFNLYFLDDISTAPVTILPPGRQTLLTALRMAERIRWEVLERFKDAKWTREEVSVCTIAFSRIEREGHLFGDWDIEDLCTNYDKHEREKVRNLVLRLRALKGYSPRATAARAGELDVAFELYEPERIAKLMDECRDVINEFLHLTFQVLGGILKE